LAGYSPEQLAIIRRIIAIGHQRGSSTKEIKAALETGAVESNFSNPSAHTDHDSEGWRQERASLYKNPTNLDASINRFYDETSAVKGKYGTSGALAAAVQRPAAQYRGRYQEHSAQAEEILRHLTPGSVSGATGRVGARAASTVPERTVETEKFDQGGYEKARKLSVLGNYLAQHNPNSPLLKFGIAAPGQVDPENFVSTKATTLPAGSVGPPGPGGRGAVLTRLAGATGRISPHARPGDPVVSSQQSEGGTHETAGLPGYPAHDFMAPSGTHAVAPVSGTVVKLSGHDPAAGPTQGAHGPLGWSVYIKGNDGKEYFLTHMGDRNVKVGQRVKQGQVIGTVADYAKYGTPSHIHLGVHG
jgi:murein DD-endopeptidase MepM/ murein hydrolase activator NlpD